MSKPSIATRQITTVHANLARVSIASGYLFVALVLSPHVLEPEVDPTWRFTSEYALGSFGWLMNVAFLALAISLLSAGLALTSQVRTWPGYIGLGVLAMAAGGMLLAAPFNTDPITNSPGEMTFSGSDARAGCVARLRTRRRPAGELESGA
jgi:hypothetical protein